jgi:hypothetical protein
MYNFQRINITYSDCVCSLLSTMQNACAILYCRLWPVRPYYIYPRYLITGTNFGGGGITGHKMCFHFFHIFRLKHFSLKRLSEMLS